MELLEGVKVTMKSARQIAILEIITESPIETQEELIFYLNIHLLNYYNLVFSHEN